MIVTNYTPEDYQKLLRLDVGSYPQAGKPIDPSSRGPRGRRGPTPSMRRA